jgi:hypothetical protein
VARMDQSRWEHTALTWDVRLRNRTERPKTRRADTFKRVAGGQRSGIAQNKRKWITHTTSVKATSLGVAHVVAKHPSSPELHQQN